MKKSYAILLCLFFAVSVCEAQSRGAKIVVEYKSEDGKIQLICQRDSQIAGFFTIQIRLENPENINTTNVITRVVTTGSVIETFTPQDTKRAYGLGRYSYSYIRGKLAAKPNQSAVYRLPMSQSLIVKALPLSYLRETYAGEAKPDDWRCFQFALSKGDTIYAARRGQVVEIVDDVDYVTDEGHVSYSSYANYIIIEHQDGTLSRYDVLEKGSMMVKLGETVYPSTPIALAGSYNKADYQVRLSVNPVVMNTDKDAPHPFRYANIDPLFSTDKGVMKLVDYEDYQPVVTDALIEAEMKKSEIAKRRK